MTQDIEDLTKRNLIKRRFEIIIEGRLKRKEAIKKAIQIQDTLSKKSKEWNGANQIRKWREQH
ncbi:MAG: hypothetical protein Q7S74_05625 [Nanoarchaeota archaeon]|nr:hypothetical protein [Nanoarchaeota archaeon]